MTIDRSMIADEIETAVRATPGVVALYRAGSLVQNVLIAGAEALGLAQEASLVAIDGEPATVRVSIGVHDEAGAMASVRRAHEAVVAVLATHGITDATVQLTVAHVAEAPSAPGS